MKKTVKKFTRAKSPQTQTIAPTATLTKESKFPSIYRSITETAIFSLVRRLDTLALIACISGLLFLGTAITVVSAYQNTQQLKGLIAQKQQRVAEMEYWKEVFAEHTGYRDAAFQVAVIAYQLGNLNEAKNYIKKTLAIDPNFQKGRELAMILGVK